MAPATLSDATVEVDDVQGLVLRGYGGLREATFLLFGIDDPAGARRWLTGLLPRLNTGGRRPGDTALNVAFTVPGLARLGLGGEAVESFPLEVRQGMATEHRRRLLGDVDVAGPERWAFGGPATPPVHVLLLVYALESRLAPLVDELAGEAAGSGLSELARLETTDIGDREHFGFRDGVSQPRLTGVGDDGPADHAIRPGEFVLGYRNEYGLFAPRPLVRAEDDPRRLLAADVEGGDRRDLGRNGSFLVLRQLEQDVRAFWRFADAAAGNGGGAEARDRIAAKLVGRWRSGAPLVLAPDRDDERLADENAFRYHAADPAGLRCPVGAHIRRTNPRDSLDPDPGSEESVAVGKRHRLLRRGRSYGPRLAPEDALGRAGHHEPSRGLYFMCLNTNVARQFEFVQQTWVNSPKFGDLYDEPDPVVAPGGSFSIPARPVRHRLTGVPRFVTTRGAEYLFLPGIRALRYLATLDG